MKKKSTGVTLIELMVVVAILAILLAVGVPAFETTVKNNRVQSQLRELADHLKFARSKAVSVQRNITICHLDNANSCDNNWSDGWTVFFDDDADGNLENPGNDTLRVHRGVAPNVLTVDDAGGVAQNFLRYSNRGVTNARLTIKLCDVGADTFYARALLVEQTGLVFMSRANNATGVHRDINNADLTC